MQARKERRGLHTKWSLTQSDKPDILIQLIL
jgi:hypothetical protein